MTDRAGGNGGGEAETSPRNPPTPKPAGPFQVGDRVERVSHVDQRVMYASEVVAVCPVSRINERTGKRERVTLYQLAGEDGEPSPVKVKASALRRIE